MNLLQITKKGAEGDLFSPVGGILHFDRPWSFLSVKMVMDEPDYTPVP